MGETSRTTGEGHTVLSDQFDDCLRSQNLELLSDFVVRVLRVLAQKGSFLLSLLTRAIISVFLSA